jgi:hypothetical protein
MFGSTGVPACANQAEWIIGLSPTIRKILAYYHFWAIAFIRQGFMMVNG